MYKAQKAPGGRGIFPCYAPPVLMDHKAGVSINQTHSIQHYLARKHGLLPETEQDIAAAELVLFWFVQVRSIKNGRENTLLKFSAGVFNK